MPETDPLTLKVESGGVKTATGRLKDLAGAAKGTEKATDRLTTANRTGERATDKSARATSQLAQSQKTATRTTKALSTASGGLGKSMAGLLLRVSPLVLALAGFRKLVSSTVDLQNYQAQLKTATGSVESAGVAFEALEDFASGTPFALGQSLDAFIKLTNLGLTPSERALQSYGNTASAMGKDLTQLIEAVADAATGEFERLKEFGIKAKSEGDQVSLTFQGVTTQIGKNAAEIEDYLIRIGENEFAGAMSDRMETVGGQISNLGDLWDQLFRTISELGAGEAIGASIQVAIDVLENFIAVLESGQFENSMAGWVEGLSGFADDFELTIKHVADLFDAGSASMSESAEGPARSFIDSMKLVPAYIRAAIQRIAIELYTIVGTAQAIGSAIVDSFVQAFKLVLQSAQNYGQAIGQALASALPGGASPGDAMAEANARQAKLVAQAGKNIQSAYNEAIVEVRALADARQSEIQDSKAQLQATKGNVDALAEQSKILRENYEKEKAARDAARGDRLAGFKIGGGGSAPAKTSGAASSRGGASSGGLRSVGPSDFDNLQAELAREESLIEESYFRRLDLVRNNTEAGSAIRAELSDKLLREYESETAALAERRVNEIDVLRGNLEDQEAEIANSYQRRRDLILENTNLTETEKYDLINRLESEQRAVAFQRDKEAAAQRLEVASGTLDGLARLAESGNERLARVGRAAMAVQKGIAIAQATIKTYESATSAYAAMAPIPYIGPALGVAAAAAAIASGVANVAAIQSTNVGGFAQGGIVPGSAFSGDRLTASVNSGEMILNQNQQASLFRQANGSNAGGAPVVNVYNNTSADVSTSSGPNGEIEIVIEKAAARAEEKIAGGIYNGSGQVANALDARDRRAS